MYDFNCRHVTDFKDGPPFDYFWWNVHHRLYSQFIIAIPVHLLGYKVKFIWSLCLSEMIKIKNTLLIYSTLFANWNVTFKKWVIYVALFHRHSSPLHLKYPCWRWTGKCKYQIAFIRDIYFLTFLCIVSAKCKLQTPDEQNFKAVDIIIRFSFELLCFTLWC